MNFNYLSVLALLLLFSCTQNTEEADTSMFGYEYFPLQTGKTWIYQSDSIIYSRGGTQIDTFRSFIREEVGDFTEDIEGNKEYKIFRSMRRNNDDAWTRLNTFTAYVDKTRAIRKEENIKLVKLVFPIKENQRFDGNVFVDKSNKIIIGGEVMDVYKDWRHRIEKVGQDYDFKGTNVKTCHINLVEDESILDKRDVKEIYAENIGLLEKTMLVLELNPSQTTRPWNEKITRGFIHHLTLIEYQ